MVYSNTALISWSSERSLLFSSVTLPRGGAELLPSARPRKPDGFPVVRPAIASCSKMALTVIQTLHPFSQHNAHKEGDTVKHSFSFLN
jgi:hypothetical protein